MNKTWLLNNSNNQVEGIGRILTVANILQSKQVNFALLQTY
jgi:hypothetical protein